MEKDDPLFPFIEAAIQGEEAISTAQQDIRVAQANQIQSREDLYEQKTKLMEAVFEHPDFTDLQKSAWRSAFIEAESIADLEELATKYIDILTKLENAATTDQLILAVGFRGFGLLSDVGFYKIYGEGLDFDDYKIRNPQAVFAPIASSKGSDQKPIGVRISPQIISGVLTSPEEVQSYDFKDYIRYVDGERQERYIYVVGEDAIKEFTQIVEEREQKEGQDILRKIARSGFNVGLQLDHAFKREEEIIAEEQRKKAVEVAERVAQALFQGEPVVALELLNHAKNPVPKGQILEQLRPLIDYRINEVTLWLAEQESANSDQPQITPEE